MAGLTTDELKNVNLLFEKHLTGYMETLERAIWWRGEAEKDILKEFETEARKITSSSSITRILETLEQKLKEAATHYDMKNTPLKLSELLDNSTREYERSLSENSGVLSVAGGTSGTRAKAKDELIDEFVSKSYEIRWTTPAMVAEYKSKLKARLSQADKRYEIRRNAELKGHESKGRVLHDEDMMKISDEEPSSSLETIKCCFICFVEMESKNILEPCRHANTCSGCAEKLMELPTSERKCPTCKRAVRSLLRIYQ